MEYHKLIAMVVNVESSYNASFVFHLFSRTDC